MPLNTDEDIHWEKTGEKEFKGAFKKYLTKYFKQPNGKEVDFDITTLKNNGFSMCLALTPDKKVVIAKQFRPGPEKISYDMPAGILEIGETPEVGIIRELKEETGYAVGKLIELNHDGNMIGPYDQALGYYYLALDCKLKHKQQLDDDEIIEVITMPLKQFVNDVLRTGLTTHADCGWLAIDYLLQHKMIKLEDISI